MPSDLTEEVKALARAEGAHLVGIASVERFEGAPSGHHPTDLLRDARSVVVIAHRFPMGLLEGGRRGRKPELIPDDELFPVRQQAFSPGGAGFFYPTANMRLQMIALQVACFLEDYGYLSTPLPASGYRAANRYVLFSHRHAAVLAGLGEFGWNNLLLTPKYGPRVRLDSIITRAPLAADPLCEGPICLGEGCKLCLQANECFGERYDLEMAGKTMQLARFSGVCPSEACENGERPYIRFCYGVCPVGKG
jgi:epoxyqueuosine reductase